MPLVSFFITRMTMIFKKGLKMFTSLMLLMMRSDNCQYLQRKKVIRNSSTDDQSRLKVLCGLR